MFSKPASNPYLNFMSLENSTKITLRAAAPRLSVRPTVLMMTNGDIEKNWKTPISELVSKKVQVPELKTKPKDIHEKFEKIPEIEEEFVAFKSKNKKYPEELTQVDIFGSTKLIF